MALVLEGGRFVKRFVLFLISFLIVYTSLGKTAEYIGSSIPSSKPLSSFAQKPSHQLSASRIRMNVVSLIPLFAGRCSANCHQVLSRSYSRLPV